MIYDLLAYIIISIAIFAMIKNILSFFTKKSKCSGCTGNCEIKTFKFPKKELLKSYDQYRLKL